LVAQVCRQIVTILQIDNCRFDPGTTTGLPILDATGKVIRAGRVVDVARHGLPTDSTIALMVRSGGITYGHLLLTAATRVVRPSPEQLRVSVTLADQAGIALAASNGSAHRAG
jgi:GAF domain-containing protein